MMETITGTVILQHNPEIYILPYIVPKTSRPSRVPPKKDTLRLAYVGRFECTKGFDLLIRALDSLGSSINITVDVAGSDKATSNGGNIFQETLMSRPQWLIDRVRYHGPCQT